LEASTLLDRTKFEKRCTALETLIQERQVWESSVDPRIDNVVFEMSSLRAELAAGLATARRDVDESTRAFERSIQISQQHVTGEVQKINHQLTVSIEEESRLRVSSLQEMSKKVDTDISEMRCEYEKLKEELLGHCDAACSQLERTISELRTTATVAAEQQMSNLTYLMRTNVEAAQQDLHKSTEGLRGAIIEERNSLVKMIEEDRAGFRKAQEDQTRFLEEERDTRSRQTTELRLDFVKAVTKEREERIVDDSGHRSEVSKVVREWHAFKNSAGFTKPPRQQVQSPSCEDLGSILKANSTNSSLSCSRRLS